MTVITRFAPSPTGTLHIGGARTALFNYLFARHSQGKFLLRIEDTDAERSTPEATKTILESLTWLGLDWDEEPIYQSTRADRHREVANLLLESGHAYRCYLSNAEIALARQVAKERREQYRLKSPWRDFAGKTPDRPYAVRLKIPEGNKTQIQDIVQGSVSWKNQDLEDLVLLRSDGTPTYMLAVVVDDHDMGITHILRGDDHLTNTAKQANIYDALSWQRPSFTHIPLIHGPDGKKYSKRDGALGLEHYAEQGYLPPAMRNYLTRLGWAHGDEEIFGTDKAIEWFTLEAIGKSPARLDPKKLSHTNAVYLRELKPEALLDDLQVYLARHRNHKLRPEQRHQIAKILDLVTVRTKSLGEIADMVRFLTHSTYPINEELAWKHYTIQNLQNLAKLSKILRKEDIWEKENLENVLREFAVSQELPLGKIAQPLRIALTHSATSPGIFDVMVLIGKEATLEAIRGAGMHTFHLREPNTRNPRNVEIVRLRNEKPGSI